MPATLIQKTRRNLSITTPDWLGVARATATGLVGLLVVSCSCKNKNSDPEAAVMVGKVRSELRPLTLDENNTLSEAENGYLDYYGIDVDRSRYTFGSFESRGVTLSAQISRAPAPSKGTVIIVHGYLDHTGSEKNIITHLAEEGYNVATYDQPGHGLSGGDPVSTWSFVTYRQAFDDFLDMVTETLPPPYHAVGHSMGGTVLADHMLIAAEDSPLERVILATPLIRDTIPRPVRRLGIMLSPLIEYVPRIPASNSTDESLGTFVMADPLQYRCVSSHSARSFAMWLWHVRKAPPNDWEPLILNAADETVIDGEFTHKWLKRTFPKGRHITFEGRHQLFNEVEPIRKKVLAAVSAELER